MEEVIYICLINSPFIASGFSFLIKSIRCLKLLAKFSEEKLFLPIDAPIFPSLSCLI